MKLKLHALSLSALYGLLLSVANASAALNNIAGRPIERSMMAESPFTAYTGSVAIYVILVGFLVATLLIGGILTVNLGLMSKREADHTGERNPSDVGILKGTLWPRESEKRMLPAKEGVDAELPFQPTRLKPRPGTQQAA